MLHLPHGDNGNGNGHTMAMAITMTMAMVAVTFKRMTNRGFQLQGIQTCRLPEYLDSTWNGSSPRRIVDCRINPQWNTLFKFQDDDVDDKRSGDEWRTGYSDLTCCKLGKLGVVGEPDLGQTIPFARRGKHPQLRRTGFGTRQDEDDNQEEEDGRCSRTNRGGLRMDSHWTWNGVSSRSRYRSPWKNPWIALTCHQQNELKILLIL